MTLSRQDAIANARRVVIKLGRAVITAGGTCLDRRRLASLVRDIANVRRRGVEIILVSSGAVATGMEILGLDVVPTVLHQKQAVAAVGQSRLIAIYEELFKKRGLKVAQVLLTHADFAHRKRYLNAKHAISSLLDYNVVPIINENDSVSAEEIQFGDNDQLSALCSVLCSADLLVILSDVDGLYDKNPKQDSSARLLTHIAEIDDGVEAMAGKTKSTIGTGGMRAKLQAIRELGVQGIPTIVAGGKREGIIASLFSNKALGTFFAPTLDPITSRKHWIGYTLKTAGKIQIDGGAVTALLQHKTSLLPVGVVAVEGEFQMGDAIAVCDSSGVEIARGLSGYSATEIELSKGCRTEKVAEILGYLPAVEVIHRDDLVIMNR